MDDLRFDRLTKTLGVAGTRRAATWLLAGGTLGALLGRTGLVPALAAERGGHCRGVRHSCHRDEHCCSNHCEQGFCKCKKRGKCDTGKACCSGKCHDGKCEPAAGAEGWGCDPKKYYCFRNPSDFPKGTPVSFTTVEVPTCFTYLPNDPCLPGVLPKCPRSACQACNERFPTECQGQCHAADRYYYDPSARNRLVC